MNNRPCPACRAIGKDEKGDHLFLMNDKRTWTCLHGTKYHPVYMTREPESATITETIVSLSGTMPLSPETTLFMSTATPDISSLVSVADRGISVETRRVYSVVTECSQVDGAPVKHYYPVYVEGAPYTYKGRIIETKDFFWVKKLKGKQDLFGIQTLKGVPRRLVLTEGEEDAMAVFDMLKKTHPGVPVLGIPGSNGLGVVKNNMDILKSIGELYFAPDNDPPGQELATELAKLFPRIKIIKLPLKDANDMLIAGRQTEFTMAFDTAEKYRPPFLVRVRDVKQKACVAPQYGRSWPWPTLQKWTYGMRDGEGMFIGAGVKIGKSELLNELIKHRILANDGDIPAVIKFEEQPPLTVKKIAGKIDSCTYHKPDVAFNLSQLEQTIDSMDGKFFMYQAFGQADWATLKEYIRYVVSEGSKTIIIDPITKLTNHLSPSDTETELRKISDELACMAQDLGFFYIVTCHLKAPTNGVPHERGGKVESVQFRGSRAMMENCFYMLGIERNKDPNLEEAERNTSQFVLLEDRNFGNAGRFPVAYDATTGDYLEPAMVF